MRIALKLSLCWLLFACGPLAWPGEAKPLADDPAIEARMLVIADELRCLVCQNQTIADSHSGLADDLRREIREMLVSGKSNQEVIDFMVARYGDFVRYRPPFKISTALLWLGPFLMVLIGGFAVFRFFKQSREESSS
jgi:cytochrome c-type biogenesis protein CcmH